MDWILRRQTLLTTTKDRKMWRAMIAHSLKEQGTKKKKKYHKCEMFLYRKRYLFFSGNNGIVFNSTLV